MAQPNYRQLARRAAKKYGLDPNVFERQIAQESGFNPRAISPAGARGIAQFMPGTASDLGINPDNPRQALDGAAKLMASYVHKYGSYKDALVAYNAGPGRVGGSLPAETRNYVASILGGKTPRVSGRSFSTPSSTSGGTVEKPGTDPRTALALSLLGNSYDSLDPLNLALQTVVQKAPARSVVGANRPSAPKSGGSYGKATFDGKPVVSWIAPILERARKTGLWKGSVTSGIRSPSEQLAAAKRYGLQHYPHGPLASNHVAGHRGAVDVSDPQGLKAALRAIHVNRLKSSMPEDPVHFSQSGY